MIYVCMTNDHGVRRPIKERQVRDRFKAVLLGVGPTIEEEVKAVAVEEIRIGANLAPATKRP
jgi:hypothetical protein